MGYLPKSAKNISYLRSICEVVEKGKYRLAVRRDYRVVYRINELEKLVIVEKVGHRSKVYK